MRTVFLLMLSAFLVMVLADACTEGPSAKPAVAAEPVEPEDYEAALKFLDEYIVDTVSNPWDSVMAMPDDNCIKLRLNYPGGTLKTLFSDSNYLHYAQGENIGIIPLADNAVSWPIRRPLERVRSNRYYYVDNLTYSYPFLIPESHALLDEIGRRFHDTLQARGGGNYRLKVTSLLRTAHSVARLRRVNRASVDSSAHLFGTTFDISFTNFPYDGGTPHRTQEDLKNLLAEILYSLKQDGRCYVIYERKPGCFHITVRGDSV